MGTLPPEPNAALIKLAFFQGLDPDEQDLILKRFRPEHHNAGTVIFLQDQPADRLYLLVSGQVEIVFKPYDGEQLTVSLIDPGGVFGWSAALGRSGYTSSARCAADSECLSIRGSDLRRMCEEHPATGVVLLERLAEAIAQRLTSTHEHVMELLRQGIRPVPES
ncbi:MAG TPA: cyclic nucleotide-binding domain-containing protein [Anaerolineales bacterium]|nr:cyclic nucleotide-binding domain-containing protein [Anaerolineales bacterium]